jgi:uncharacterized protein YegP (UPF0339 family)
MNRSGQYIEIYDRNGRFCWRVKNHAGEIVETSKTGYVLRTLCIHEVERVHPDLAIFEQEK